MFHDELKSLIVIPARLASTRLPRKLLLRDTGKTVIQHTYEAASTAELPAGVCVATDHVDIAQEVRRFGGEAVMTDPQAASGTDRVAEVAAARNDVEVIVNVQGDEPEIAGTAIDTTVRLLCRHPTAVMSTLATPIRSLRSLQDPACVKVVINARGEALYFSRSPIPFAREGLSHGLLMSSCYRQHIGVYAYRRDFLLRLATFPPSPLEELERLEQLRVLDAGFAIQVGSVEHAAAGIDTPDDYRAFVTRQLSHAA